MRAASWSLAGGECLYSYVADYGYVHLDLHRPGHHVATMRVKIDPEYRRSGFGRRLVEIALEFAPTIGVRRVEWTPWVDNPESISFALAVGTDLGFQFEGVKRAAGNRDGRLVDVYLYAWIDWQLTDGRAGPKHELGAVERYGVL